MPGSCAAVFQMWVWDCACVHGVEDAAADERKEQNQEGLWTECFRLTIDVSPSTSAATAALTPLDSSAPPVKVSC